MRMRTATPADAAWIAERLAEEWGGPTIWADGRAFDCTALPALIAGKQEGLAVYAVAGARAELVLLEAIEPGRGIGTVLLTALVERVAGAGVRGVWLTTTNDNLDALHFYQRQGFRFVEVRAGAMDGYRKLKPSIPLVGKHGIAIRDELRLVMDISPGA